ncbi:bifunctional transcriptional activator/DNA repair enzyme AdaA [Paenibacillus piri]|uniref:Methylphosphotriester-DNA--protein-cysteine methyltransferase family protein n=1 Tax=Paenibacillus piri TaxID=2547395 RepID=A0A4R5L0F7_9BACL|nr:bifunctional transcriptional activator/DNA repair enzyme AdaA [Paenibacillus piri]TDG00986.1 methylphosphotriester-DNA--protein-cysteine methyltransferase family protein [Paenibacillus piri]
MPEAGTYKIDAYEARMTDEKWCAIVNNDASYDDKFFYAVKTTGIFCRPSCKSKAPKLENVRIFSSAREALAESFRPCKRCRPTGERLPDYEWADQIVHYIDMNYSEKLTLETLADMCHGSPYHLQRTFKKVTGITPVEYIQQTRINKAKADLTGSRKQISDIALSVGMPNTPYFITLFKKLTGQTPAEYRQFNQQMTKPEVHRSGNKN